MAVIFVLLFLAQASALTIVSPSAVEVNNKEEFFVEITNNSNTQKDLRVNFFSTVMSDVIVPNFVPPNTTVRARIIVYNKYESYTEINSKLEVYLDNEFREKNVLLKFLEKNERDNLGQSGSEFAQNLNSFFVLFAANTGESFLNLNDYSNMEIIFITVLILLILVLIVALVVRIVKRA